MADPKATPKPRRTKAQVRTAFAERLLDARFRATKKPKPT